ncbi:MAG TPA: hypothetical protein VFW40_03735 [Capsulimonadaceae bacterium]|nr:hypothetical protein [Capsulimonadaceae bacterium]
MGEAARTLARPNAAEDLAQAAIDLGLARHKGGKPALADSPEKPVYNNSKQ